MLAVIVLPCKTSELKDDMYDQFVKIKKAIRKILMAFSLR